MDRSLQSLGTMPNCRQVGFRHVGAAAVCFFVLLLLAIGTDATSIGAVFGRSGDNIPSAATAAALMQQYSITRVRIYDHDTSVIQAFGSTQIRVIIAVTNSEIPSIAAAQSTADSWVSTNVAPYIKGTNINAIAVGNEVLTSNSSVSAMLLPAMQNIHTALQSQGFDASVKVSSPHGLGLLEVSYPPSSGVFFTNIVSVMQPLLDFLNTTGSFFMLNVYPFLAYENSVSTVSLGYALFNSASPVTDSNNGLIYYNLYDAQIDALVSAMGKLNHGSLGVMVTETGWPSDGDPSYEPAANFTNAEMYNQNLVKRTMNNSGTPLRPNQEIDSYIVSLYDEDLRSVPPASNRHWGLFYPNGTFKYDFNFLNGNTGGSGSGGGGTNGSTNGTSPPPPPGTSPSSSSQNVWCVAKQGSSNASLQQGLDWACGPGKAMCDPIQPGGDCYLPNTVISHASYAFNIHYHWFQSDPRSCVFGGDATLTNVDPSYGSCYYIPSSAMRLRISSSLLFVAVVMFLFLKV